MNRYEQSKLDFINLLEEEKGNLNFKINSINSVLETMEITEPKQLNLYSEPSGEELRDIGMEQAESHANDVHESWGDKAYQFLLDYNTGGEFMTEDVRKASEGIISEPPSLRAWGGIVRRAAKNGVIKRVGYRSVSNNKAHCTPASVWVKI